MAGAGALVIERSARQRLIVTGPLAGFAGCAFGEKREFKGGCFGGLRHRKQSQRVKLLRRHYSAGMAFQNRDYRVIGSIFRLEVLGTGGTRGMRGGFIRAAYGLAHAAHKFFELFLSVGNAGDGDPSLMVPWAGGLNNKHGGADTVELLCIEVVELDKCHTGAPGSDDEVLSRHQSFAIGQLDEAADGCVIEGNFSRNCERL